MDDKIRDAKGRFITGHKRLCPLNDHGRFISYNSVEYVENVIKDCLANLENEDLQMDSEYDEGVIKGYRKGIDFALQVMEKFGKK